MAVTVPADEKLLERLTSFVGGKVQEFVLTDKAVYYEGQRSQLATWFSAAVMPVLTILGLGLFYFYLRGGRLFVRHSLERIDAVTTRRVPLPLIVTTGGLLALLFGVCLGLQTYLTTGDAAKSVLYGYLTAALISLGATILLLRFQLSSLSVNSLNGNFTFETFKSFEDVKRVQEGIWAARARLLLTLTVPSGAAPAQPVADPEAAEEPQPERQGKRR